MFGRIFNVIYIYFTNNKKTPNEPFRRVKCEEVMVHSKFSDNSFEAKVITFSNLYKDKAFGK